MFKRKNILRSYIIYMEEKYNKVLRSLNVNLRNAVGEQDMQTADIYKDIISIVQKWNDAEAAKDKIKDKIVISPCNRDGAKIWVDENGLLKSDKDWVLEHIRVGFDKTPEDIIFIDPSGGPMIEIGNVYDGHPVTGFEQTPDGIKIIFN